MNPFKSLFDLIIPRVCHICNEKLLESEKFVCHECMEKLPRTRYELYWNNKTGPNTDLNPMEQRFAGQLLFDRAIAPFFYTRDSSLARLVHDFKYRGFSRLATSLARQGADELKSTGFFDNVDFLIPIPLHWYKKYKRGYNQTEFIAEGIKEVTGIPVSVQLKAKKPHRTQTSLTTEQRIANTRGIFSVENPEILKGKTVILVDDICTTGATLLSAGEAIAAATGHDIGLRLFTLGVV